MHTLINNGVVPEGQEEDDDADDGEDEDDDDDEEEEDGADGEPDVSNMTPQVKAAHTMFCADILKELGLGQAPRTEVNRDEPQEVDPDETQEVDPDETQDGGHGTRVDDGAGGRANDGGREDTFCDIDAEGL